MDRIGKGEDLMEELPKHLQLNLQLLLLSIQMQFKALKRDRLIVHSIPIRMANKFLLISDFEQVSKPTVIMILEQSRKMS
jgi:hypothetical protein